jgi:3D (Asp-Asp-Asp) domain-containing protein
MRLSRSAWAKLVATALAAVGFALSYEAGTIDSHGSIRTRKGGDKTVPVAPGASLTFEATGYCKGDTTAAGVNVGPGIAAADPAVLPEGSVIQVDGVSQKYRGIYTVLDTGPKVQGRAVDLYIWSCYDALDLGRVDITLTVLRLGWDPRNTAPGLIR